MAVRESMGKTIVEQDFQLICFDIVSEPSTPDAFVYPENKSAPIRMRENKENKPRVRHATRAASTARAARTALTPHATSAPRYDVRGDL